MKKFLYWLPRILSILFICFLTLFSLDVFEIDAPWYQLLLGFLVHSIPSIVLGGVTILAWKKPKIGGWFFVAAGLALAILTRFNLMSVTIYVPPVLVGALYLLSVEKKPVDKPVDKV